MIQQKIKLIALGLIGVLAVGIGTTQAAGDGSLIVNGKANAADIRTINGSTYVKLSDVARAFGMVVVKKGGAYELAKAGGANQINGVVQGKIGEQLFNGRWRFMVLGTDITDSYTLKTDGEPYPYHTPVDYNSATRTLSAKDKNKLVTVTCRVANGQKTTENLWLKNPNTALTDTNGESYSPISFDVSGAPAQTKPMLPGSKVEMTLVFCLPQSAKVNDLVFTLKDNNSEDKGSDVRVSLGAS